MKKWTMNQKKWLLSLHLFFAGIMLGEWMVILVLNIVALNTDSQNTLQACYTVMHLLSSPIKASTIGSTVSGILLSLFSHWGLFRYYWIIVKEALTLLTIVIGVAGFQYWSLNGVTIVSAEGLDALRNPAFQVNNGQLWVGIILQLLSLIGLYVISVFKPWGPRKTASKNAS